MHTRSRALSAGCLALLTTSVGLLALPAAAAPGEVFVSELHYDNAGTDAGEAVEVEADAGTDLTGWSVVLYNGNGGAVYDDDDLPGTVPDAGVVVLDYPANGIQNGSPDALALVDADGAVVEFLSYEGVITATDGPAAGTTSTDIGVSEAGSEPVGQSLQKLDGAWSGPAPATFGVRNGADPGPEPDPLTCDTEPTTTIPELQGTGDATPLIGQEVVVSGVVVGDTQAGLDTFHVQDPAGDGDPATSDAVVVFGDAVDVALGDEVVVRGTATEFFGLTEISPATTVVCGSGATLPEAAELDLPAGDAEREALEGMLVRPVDELTVTEVFNLNRFGEVQLAEGGRLVNPTEVVEPGAPAIALAAANAERSIVLDDAVSANLATAGLAPPYLAPGDPVRVGDVVSELEPVVLSYGFDLYRLQPADGAADGTTFDATNPRPAAPEDVGGDVRAAAFNVLNYFVNFGGEARGAGNPEELARQQAKIVAAVAELDADVVALQEIENSSKFTPADPFAALRTLVDALNAVEGAGTWDYVRAGEPAGTTGDFISNAIIFKPAALTPVGEPVVADDPEAWDNAREPIAQTFAPTGVAGGDAFTVIGNHFKSKGSGDGANADTGDGQGASNPDRVQQAEALAVFAAEVAAAAGDEDVLLLGDFNAYSLEDPIDVLRAAGYTDLAPAFAPGDYTYVFAGQSGSLDHALSSPSLTAKVTGVDVWNINAVESFAYQYDGYEPLFAPDPYRASDHDPVVLGIDLDDPPVLCGGVEATIVGTDSSDLLVGSPGPDVVAALGGVDLVLGLGGDDVICGGGGVDTVLAGAGDDTVYGGAGTDVLLGEAGDDDLFGGSGVDLLLQGSGTGTVQQGGPEG